MSSVETTSMHLPKATSIWTISNGLSIMRIPLALVFLIESPLARCSAIFCAMLTDILDGYLSRRYQQSSQFGAVLDPLMDKFFTVFAMLVLLTEGRLSAPEMGALICRDFAIVLFGIYLYLSGQWARYRFRAIWCGKATTALQFFVLMALTLGYVVPFVIYATFVVLGLFALIELYLMARPTKVS